MRRARTSAQHPEPPRHQWHIYESGLAKMQRGLWRWQLPLPTITDRSGNRFLERIKNRNIVVIDAALSLVVATDAFLCTDGAAAYRRFSSKTGMTHHVVSNTPGRHVIQRAFHIQNVNSLHQSYGEFIKLFRGPASTYRERYLRWFLLRSKLEPKEALGRVLTT